MMEQKTIKIYNTSINEAGILNPHDFLIKVKNVKMIRTDLNLSFTFYPADQKEIERNRLIWEHVNGNFNAINSKHKYYFCTEFPEWLYLFLKYSTWENVEKSIIVALTGFYVINPKERSLLEQEIEQGILFQVKEHFLTTFKDFENFVFIESEDFELMSEINSDYWEKEQLFITKFDYFFRDNSGNPIILPFIYPIRDFRYRDKSMFASNKFNVECANSYFNDSDWDNIINKDSSDSMHRSESLEEPWKKWKQRFMERNKIENELEY